MTTRFTAPTFTRVEPADLPDCVRDMSGDRNIPTDGIALGMLIFVGVPHLHRMTDADKNETSAHWEVDAFVRMVNRLDIVMHIASTTAFRDSDSIDGIVSEFSDTLVRFLDGMFGEGSDVR